MSKTSPETIVVLDFGSPYTHLITRRARSAHVYCEILPYHSATEEIKAKNPRGLIFSGNPNSLPEDFASWDRAGIFDLGLPILGFAHDLQALADLPCPTVLSPDILNTPQGLQALRSFLFDSCGCSGNWRMESYLASTVEEIQEQVGDKQVLLGLSGGVDSSVVCALLYRAIGEQLTAVFVDHGLLRKNERAEVEAVFRPQLKEKLVVVDASQRFLKKLVGVSEPEQKRKIIGAEFIAVFSETARSLSSLDFLAQGTIYPDIVESKSADGKVIKSHHNVGGLPEDLPFCGLVEPLRHLFKDEVRELGLVLGLPERTVKRPPFPGPGLAVRVIGEVTEEKLAILREADAIVREEVAQAAAPNPASQYFAILTGLRSVGVKNNERSYDYTVAVRAVSTSDFMTADWVRLPHEVLDTISRRIINEAPHVNRVVYDITAKPPASIEWE
jgi:GMP synthase (glutamine-hydrolysing)